MDERDEGYEDESGGAADNENPQRIEMDDGKLSLVPGMMVTEVAEMVCWGWKRCLQLIRCRHAMPLFILLLLLVMLLLALLLHLLILLLLLLLLLFRCCYCYCCGCFLS